MTLPAPTENSTYLEPPPRLGIRLGSGRSHRLDRRVTPGVFQRVHLLRRWPRLKPALDARHRYDHCLLPPHLDSASDQAALEQATAHTNQARLFFPFAHLPQYKYKQPRRELTTSVAPRLYPQLGFPPPCPISPRFDIRPTARPGIIDTRLGSPPTHPECPGYPLHLPCSRRLEPRVFKYPTILPRATVLHLRNESPSSIAASLNRIGSRIAPARP
ncbi:hypothetical protein HYQ45_018515 [Verticillium longisporum]|uniref:Uncharacterized protein n=1 Tax=Verticillium longisporum TaxID=100787 RepID=A0A8I2Z069_VERLO|nr:hypothetical protein HYQ45_018515 [Verticillium longisporum]